MKKRVWTFCLMVAWTAGFAAAGPDASRQQDARTLADEMSVLGMVELLDAYGDEVADPQTAKYVRARSKITRANLSPADSKAREKLLDDATGLLKELIAVKPIAGDGAALLRHYRLRLDLIDVAGIMRSKSYAAKLMYLQGGQADIEGLRAVTDEVVGPLDRLRRDIEFTVEDWQEDLRKLVTLLPELESLQQTLWYKSAWIRFYRAISLPAGPQRDRLLTEAMNQAERFASGGEGDAVHWARLLAGMCARELESYQQAARLLMGTNVIEASPAVRVQAMFEMIRNAIEAGAFKQAERAVKTISAQANRLLGRTGQLDIDVKTVMLHHYLLVRRARASTDADQTSRDRRAAQQVLLDFLAKYEARPAVTGAFLKIIAGKYRDRARYDGVSSVIVLAVASQEARLSSAEALVKAETLLRMILARDDPASKQLRGETIWQLAQLSNRMRKILDAARLFGQLAGELPQHARAAQSAHNSVQCFASLVNAAENTQTGVAVELRREYIASLQRLLTTWPDRSELGAWNFELGRQYQLLAAGGDRQSIVMAITAYESMSQDDPRYMEARFLALELRAAGLDDPNELVGRLDSYAGDAKAAAEQSTDAEQARRLRQWGATTYFLAAKTVYEQLADSPAALLRLEAMESKWAQTDALVGAWEYEIAKLIELNRTSTAIDKVSAFAARHPDKARGLMVRLIGQIRDRLERQPGEAVAAKELETYRTFFGSFSKELYLDASRRQLPAEKMYPIEQLRAEAMLAVGDYSDALAMFDKCAAYDASRRAEQIEQIDRETANTIEKAKRSAGDPKLASGLAQELFRRQKSGKLGDRLSGQAAMLGEALNFYAQAETADERAKRLAIVSKRLVEASLADGEARKQAVPIDAGNIRGLARTHRAMNNFKGGGALKYYAELVAGLDRSRDAGLYWAMQLERCECLLDAFEDDRVQLRRLGALIRQLRVEDANMGQLAGEFAVIEAEAARSGN